MMMNDGHHKARKCDEHITWLCTEMVVEAPEFWGTLFSRQTHMKHHETN
jgi:hypothetical protein